MRGRSGTSDALRRAQGADIVAIEAKVLQDLARNGHLGAVQRRQGATGKGRLARDRIETVRQNTIGPSSKPGFNSNGTQISQYG